jgi:hypothetical protein
MTRHNLLTRGFFLQYQGTYERLILQTFHWDAVAGVSVNDLLFVAAFFVHASHTAHGESYCTDLSLHWPLGPGWRHLLMGLGGVKRLELLVAVFTLPSTTHDGELGAQNRLNGSEYKPAGAL